MYVFQAFILTKKVIIALITNKPSERIIPQQRYMRLYISYRYPSLGCLTIDGNVTIMLYIKSDYFFEGIV